METFKIIIHTIFIVSALINCIVARIKKNNSAFGGWLSAIIIDIPTLINTLND